ncbi:hypothetical protein D2V17_09090 [Aurantiacibacter xanthus]|uniref:Uncharacterized protein n=1 Tax=Aurantiacibacter xanthus TaxID=1784712 RepID=A0A3A1P837_9SPHN|nr:hypothetical protein D2V17_09090 [Aurantiacibacter xanthus]
MKELDPSDSTATLDFNLAHIHENVHWFQHVGTTYGAFMDALRSSQRYVLMRFLRELPRTQRKALLEDRLKTGRPFIELDPRTQYPKDITFDAPAVSLVKQIWFDHQWLHASFEDSRATDRLGHPPVDACSNVMADVILNACDTHGFLSPDYNADSHVGARDWYFTTDRTIAEVVTEIDGERVHVTSVGLMECAASLNELQWLQGNMIGVVAPDELKRIVQARIEEFVGSSYSIPFKLFHLASDRPRTRSSTLWLSLNLLVFFALNPPLPPRILSRPREPLTWPEVYPPIRFFMGLRVLDDIEPISDPQSVVEMQRYIADIANATGLEYCGDVPIPQRKYTTAEWDAASETENYPLSIDDELIIQAQLRVERIPDRLPLIANFASCLQGKLSRQFARLIFAHEERYDFLGPPLEFLKNGKVGFRGSAAFGNNVVRSVAVSAALFEFACGAGKFSLAELPSEVGRGDNMFRFMEDTLHHLIVETDNVYK